LFRLKVNQYGVKALVVFEDLAPLVEAYGYPLEPQSAVLVSVFFKALQDLDSLISGCLD